MNADELVDAYHAALKTQATASATESDQDDSRKIVLSQQILKAGDIALSKAEHVARASEEYLRASARLSAAREDAENARAEVEYLRVRFEKWRTRMSFKKAMANNG